VCYISPRKDQTVHKETKSPSIRFDRAANDALDVEPASPKPKPTSFFNYIVVTLKKKKI